MVSRLDDLGEMWDTLDTCYERLEKYVHGRSPPANLGV
jgi:hypothetical protein